MVLVFILFLFVGLAILYTLWTDKEHGRGTRIFGTIFISPFIGIGCVGVYYLLIFREPPRLPDELAKQIIAWYDYNEDGKIQRKGESAVIHCASGISCRTYSRADLFKEADQDSDSVVTRQELLKVLLTFDKNKNGKLEYDNEFIPFNRAFPQYSSNGFRQEGLQWRKEPLMPRKE